MLTSISSKRDNCLADIIEKGLKEEAKQILEMKRNKYVMIFVRELSREGLQECDAYVDEDGEAVRVDPNLGCSKYTNSIELSTGVTNFVTLYRAAQISLPGFNRAYLEFKGENEDGFFTKEKCIILYKDVNDIDFTDYRLEKFEPSGFADDDFVRAFSKRNIAITIKKYKELINSLNYHETESIKAKERIEEFKKSLDPEELLAIETENI